MRLELNRVLYATCRDAESLFTVPGRVLVLPPRANTAGPGDVRRLLTSVCAGLARLGAQPDGATALGVITLTPAPDGARWSPEARADRPALTVQVHDGARRLTALMLLTLALHERLVGSAPLGVWAAAQRGELSARLLQMIGLGHPGGEAGAQRGLRLAQAEADALCGGDGVGARGPLAAMLSRRLRGARDEATSGDADSRRLAQSLSMARHGVHTLTRGEALGDGAALPSLPATTATEALQRRHLHTPLDAELARACAADRAAAPDEEAARGFVRLVMITRYLLERVVLTEVWAARHALGLD